MTLIRGDSKSIKVQLEEAENYDLTGATVYFTAKPAITNDIDDVTAQIRVQTTQHSHPTQGETIIYLTPANTNIPPGKYYFDIQIKYADGTVTSTVPLLLEVIGDVTRRV